MGGEAASQFLNSAVHGMMTRWLLQVVTWAKSMEAVIKTKETLDLVEGFNSDMGAFERFAEPPALPKRAPNGIRHALVCQSRAVARHFLFLCRKGHELCCKSVLCCFQASGCQYRQDCS